MASGRPSNSPKTPTTRSPFVSGAELISTATRSPLVETKTPLPLRGRGRADHFLGEQLARTAAVLGRDDRSEVSTADVADQLRPPD